MLIPENGKWRWNDGPLCDSKEEALKTAKPQPVTDAATVYVVDHVESMEVDDNETP